MAQAPVPDVRLWEYGRQWRRVEPCMDVPTSVAETQTATASASAHWAGEAVEAAGNPAFQDADPASA